MSKKPPYDVPWILQRFRAFLLGREYNSALRWAKYMAPKTQPLPNLPPGSSSKIRFNYYCDRDGGREVVRPRVLYDAEVSRQRMLDKRTGPAGYLLEKEKKCKKVGLKEEGEKTKEEGEKIAEGERDAKENVAKTGEDEEKEDKGTKIGEEYEQEESKTLKRVPGKVWHWDTMDGDPTKQCCGKQGGG